MTVFFFESHKKHIRKALNRDNVKFLEGLMGGSKKGTYQITN